MFTLESVPVLRTVMGFFGDCFFSSFLPLSSSLTSILVTTEASFWVLHRGDWILVFDVDELLLFLSLFDIINLTLVSTLASYSYVFFLWYRFYTISTCTFFYCYAIFLPLDVMESTDPLQVKQLRAAIPAMYLKQYINRKSNEIDTPIPTILQNLFRTYGKVSQDEVKLTQTALKEEVHNITEQFIAIFNKVNNLQELGQAANNPKLEQQLINLGKTIVKNTREFKSDLQKWNNVPAVNQTWVHF